MWADKIIEICHSMKALPEGGAFDVSWKKMLGELQRLSLEAGLDREDEFEESEHPRDEGGKFTEKGASGGGSGVKNRVITPEVERALKTEDSEAVFFSGCSKRGKDGRKMSSGEVAGSYAKENGLSTMGMKLEQSQDDIPEWDFDDADSVSSWEDLSRVYAEQASGDVRVIARPPLREGNIFETVEFPALKKNKKVRSVTMIDPDTGEKKEIFRR